MSDDLILDQYRRLLDGLGADPWADLAESGFLDLLRDPDDGGAGLELEGLFPLAFETGRRGRAPGAVEAMVARLVDPAATETPDLEAALARGGVAAGPARALAAAVTAAKMAGAIDALLAMTLDYAGTRKQFGREISKFQAIQHQIAVMAEEAMAARMAAETALVGAPLDISPRRAAAAKLRCGQAAQVCAGIAHAVHGAIGVSIEHDLHLFTGGLHRARMAYGGEAYWARELGRWALADDRDVTSLARAL